MSTTVTATENSGAIPTPEVFTPYPVFISNNSSSAHPFGLSSNAFLDSRKNTARGHGRVPRIEESLGLRRLERAVTYPLPWGVQYSVSRSLYHTSTLCLLLVLEISAVLTVANVFCEPF